MTFFSCDSNTYYIYFWIITYNQVSCTFSYWYLFRNTSVQSNAYPEVHGASKFKNKQKTKTPEKPDKPVKDPYAETQEGYFYKAGDRRHKKKKNVEQFDSSTNSR